MKTYYKNKKGEVFLIKGLYMKRVYLSTGNVPSSSYFNDLAIIHPKIKLLKFLKFNKQPRQV